MVPWFVCWVRQRANASSYDDPVVASISVAYLCNNPLRVVWKKEKLQRVSCLQVSKLKVIYIYKPILISPWYGQFSALLLRSDSCEISLVVTPHSEMNSFRNESK